jgi:uncharacterized protein (DUF983 family)
MWTKRRFEAILRQRCPVCLEGRMFSGSFTMAPRCPKCGHEFERETGFFQGAMYVSWALSVGMFAALALLANWFLAPRVGLPLAFALAIGAYFPVVPALYRYARVIWAHVNIGTRDTTDEEAREG